MATALLALGLVLVVEGLVWAIAPRMIEDMLAALRQLGADQRRLVGLLAVALGVTLVWMARALGA